MTFLNQPSSPALTHKAQQKVWLQPREASMRASPQGTGVPAALLIHHVL